MPIITRKYNRYQNCRGAHAIVQLDSTQNELEIHRIFEETEKIPFQSQGLLEGWHNNWNSTAKAALLEALANIKSTDKYDVRIKKLEGRIFLDTNNGCIGVACILALWEFLGISAETDVLSKMDTIVRESWQQEKEVIPNFALIFE